MQGSLSFTSNEWCNQLALASSSRWPCFVLSAFSFFLVSDPSGIIFHCLSDSLFSSFCRIYIPAGIQ